jgi:hypothetical protein
MRDFEPFEPFQIEFAAAAGGGPAPAAPVIVTAGSIDEQPLVGQSVLGTEPTVTGADSVAYQWYRGAPTTTAIGGATSATYTAVAGDYGLVLYRRATYTNGAGPTVEDLAAPDIVGAQFVEDFGGFTVGDDTTDILAAGWFRWAGGTQLWAGAIATLAGGPSGKAMQFSAGTADNLGGARTDWDTFFATNSWTTKYQFLALIKADGAGARLGLRGKTISAVTGVLDADLAAGVNLRLGVPALCLPGESVNSNPAAGLLSALTGDADYFIRFEAEGAVAKVKIWLASAPEPETWTLTRPHGSTLTGRGPSLVARTTGDSQSVMFLSCAGNAAAPFWSGYVPPVEVVTDPTDFAAASSVSSVSFADGAMLINLEDV